MKLSDSRFMFLSPHKMLCDDYANVLDGEMKLCKFFP